MRKARFTEHQIIAVLKSVKVLQTSQSIVIPEPSFTAITDVQTPFARCAGSLPPAPAACEFSGHIMSRKFAGKFKHLSPSLPHIRLKPHSFAAYHLRLKSYPSDNDALLRRRWPL